MLKLANDKTNRILRHYTVLLGILVIALLLTGCTESANNGMDIREVPTREPLIYSTHANPVSKAPQMPFFVPNNLVFTQSTESELGFNMMEYSLVSGLKDEAVEAKINALIQNEVKQVKAMLEPETIAPYRGIRTVVDVDTNITNRQIFMNTYFDNNNMLSIRFSGSGSISGRQSEWINVERILNIDLNTGDHIPLKALFIDGFDYVTAINDAVKSVIDSQQSAEEISEYYFYRPFNLVKPFDGIDENQTYALSEYHLDIIFDILDPRFDAGFGPTIVSISLNQFKDHLAIFSRYTAENNSLFLDETEKRKLWAWEESGLQEAFVESGTYSGGNYHITVYNGLEKLETRMDEILDETRNWINGLNEEGDVTFWLTSSKVGPYMIVNCYQDRFLGNRSYQEQRSEIYDSEGKRIEFEDLFVDGAHYETVIKEQIKRQCNENSNYDYVKVMANYDSAVFSLSSSGVNIWIPLGYNGQYDEVFYGMIDFHEFGVRQFKMFVN